MSFDKTKENQAITYHRVRLSHYAILLVLLIGSLFSESNTVLAADASTDSFGYTSDQLEGLKFLNEVRAKVGVQPVRLNAALTKAAISHAEYYNLNHVDHPNLSAHSETLGSPGFTGKSISDRVKVAGWVSGKGGSGYGEVMHYQQKSSIEAIQGWLDTAYHRAIILDSSFEEVGIGLAGGTAVIDAAGSGKKLPIDGGVAVYPYDQQTGVPVGFYGFENPNPLEQFNVKFSGSIISAVTQKALISHKVVITDERGTEISYNEEVYGKNVLFLYPTSILKGYHKYTVSLEYQIEGSSDTKNKVWSFTTGKGHTLTHLTPNYNEVVINEGGSFQLQVQGEYDDGTTDVLNNEIKYSSNRPMGLTVSSSGGLSGIKAGEYIVTSTSEGKSSNIKVKVYPKLKTKVYPAVDSSKLTDTATVSEAEFWTMLLEAYHVNIQAYQPTKIKHWADAAYLIAKERNFPLEGLNKLSARDTRISRLKVAEIIAAVDGMHFKDYNAVKYVLGKEYVKGVTDTSLLGYQGEKLLTRAEAVQILLDLRPKLSELRGRPVSVTPNSILPKELKPRLYIKPNKIEDQMIFAEFHEDHTLTIEGKFTQFAGQSFVMMVQTGSKPTKEIQDIPITLDSQGMFKVSAGPFQQDSLNLFLSTPGNYYFIGVEYNTMNDSTYQ